MRITGGRARGISISTGRAKHVRPATDRMREAVFSSLGNRIHDSSVLDLFAGSGSYGLEALSRGASSALFVEKHPQAVTALEQNVIAVLKSLGNPKELKTKVIRRDALRFESSLSHDIIFMDAPYDLIRSRGDSLLEQASNLLSDDGILVYELPGDLSIPESEWTCLKRIGKSGTNEPSVAILEKKDQ